MKEETREEKVEKKQEPKTDTGIGIKSKIGLIVLILILIISGGYYYKLVYKYDEIPLKVVYKSQEEIREVVLEERVIYLPSESKESLVTKVVEIEKAESPEDEIGSLLGRLEEELNYTITYVDSQDNVIEIPFFNRDIEVLNIYIDRKDIYLNYNYHFKENMQTISQEILILYSIVNTLTESGQYNRVKFLINNKEIENLNFYQLSDFYRRNLDI